jgi:hypothetical protein
LVGVVLLTREQAPPLAGECLEDSRSVRVALDPHDLAVAQLPDVDHADIELAARASPGEPAHEHDPVACVEELAWLSTRKSSKLAAKLCMWTPNSSCPR